MKKLIAFVLAIAMLMSLTACASIKDVLEDVLPGETVQPPQDTVEKPDEPAPADPEEGPEGLPTPEVEYALYGNAASNIAAGGHVAISTEGQLFWAHSNGYSYGAEETGEHGIFARVGDGYEKISDDDAGDLNVWGDRLYYVAQTWNGDEGTSEIVSIKFDGSDRQVIAESTPIRWDMRISDDDNHAEYTHFGGYSDMIIYAGSLYFIGDNGKPGGQDIHSNYMDKTYSTIWHNGKSLYRTDLDGGNKTVIVENLGNGAAHFTIGDGKIWYTTCYDAGSTVYPHFTLNSCDLDGSNAQLLYGTTDTVASDAKQDIIGGIFYADGYLFVSASDSEGDFPHGRLMAYKDGYYEFWGDETYYVNYAYDGAGGLYSLFSPTDYTVYEDNTGMEYIEDAKLVRNDLYAFAEGEAAGSAQILHEFGRVDRWTDEFSHFELFTFDDGRLLTLLTKDALYTFDLENGTPLEKIVK